MTYAEKTDGRMEGLRSKRAYGADQTCGRRSAEQIIGTERKRSRDERLRKNGYEFFRDDLYEVLKVQFLCKTVDFLLIFLK